MSRRHVMIVGCGFPQLGLIRAARELDLAVTGADMNPLAIGVGLAHHFIAASTGDADAIANAFRSSGADAIATTGSELSLTITARVAAELKLPFYASPETVHRCQAKDAMRAGYEAAGLPVPKFAFCQTLDEAEAFASAAGYPLVVKPANGWGQRGVSRVNDPAALKISFENACAVSYGGRGAVIEECIVGHEVSVNGWVQDGGLVAYCVTDREVFPGNSPLGVMRSEIAPSCLSDNDVARAVDAARRGAKALGLSRGPCYSQVCVSPSRAVLFETAARMGGGFDADVTRLHCGVDLYKRILGVALEDSALENAGAVDRCQPALVRFLQAPAGRLVGIDGLSRAKECPGVVDVVAYPKAGDELPGLVDASKRVAHLLVVGESREQAISRADTAEREIRLQFA